MWSPNGRELFYQKFDGRVQMASYASSGGSFVVEKPKFWSEKLQRERGFFRAYDVAPDGKRILALIDAEGTKPQSHLRLLLNVDDELRRRTSAHAKATSLPSNLDERALLRRLALGAATSFYRRQFRRLTGAKHLVRLKLVINHRR